MKNLFFLLTIFNFYNLSHGQFETTLTLRNQFNGKYGYTIIGNTQNTIDNRQTSPQPPCQMATSSNAILNLQSNQIIVAAYLYWSGVGNGLFDQTISFNSSVFSATSIVTALPFPLTSQIYFGAFKDVTQQVVSQGNSSYNLSSLDLNPIISSYCPIASYFSGWSLLVIYEDFSLQPTQLNIYDGLNISYGTFNNGVSNIPITNLNIVDTQNASLSYVAWNGSTNLFLNESITFNGDILSNALNPANNPFNSTNSFTNSNTNWNQDIDTFDISTSISVGDTSATLVMSSFFLRLIQTVVTSIRSELPDATVLLNSISGQNVCNNRNLAVSYTVNNTNSNAALPANMPVSIFANTTFLGTFNTPSSIAIGGSLPQTQTVDVPLSVGNTFNLRVIANRTAANVPAFAESNPNNNEASQNITLLAGSNVAAFGFSNSVTQCVGGVVPILPLVSNNGISGTWSPAVVSNLASGIYTFTPIATACAANFVLSVTIDIPVAASFVGLPSAICAGSSVPVLPTTSSNGVIGSWSPSVINNSFSGSYVFTPTAGQCASGFTLNVTVLPNIVPVFSIPNTLCQGNVAAVLPIVSDNGIAGVWSPNTINNQVSGNYTFTPNASQCGLPTTISVTVVARTAPQFSVANTFCQGATVPVLPAVSVNGVSGLWSPATISNQTSGNYVFTPISSECATIATLVVSIISQSVTTQNLSICENPSGNANTSVVLNSNLAASDYTFVWSKNSLPLADITSSIVVTSAGNYKVVASSNVLGCQETINFNVEAYLPFTAAFIIKEDFISNQIINVVASGGSSSFMYSFDNEPFQAHNVYSVFEGGDILVKVRDSNNCYEITKLLTLWQYQPFFTPNGDGYNDNWSITTPKKVEVSVFDRFGKLITQLKANESWNGTFNNQNLPADDYWFVVNYEGKSYRGHFALKR